MQWIKRHYVLVSIVGFIIALNVFFYFINPREIVEYVGVTNSYVLVFSVAAIGGLSTLTGAVFYTALITFAAGGSSPLLLGIAGGLGIFISDSIFFFLARWGRESMPKRWDKWLGRIRNVIEHYPKWLVLIFAFLYLGFLPFPNDLLMLAFVLGGYRYRTVAPVILIGSVSIAFITAYFGSLWFTGLPI